MADAAPEQSVAAWQKVTNEDATTAFQTDRLKVPGGWIYRSRGIYDAKQTGLALCFVPQSHHQGDEP